MIGRAAPMYSKIFIGSAALSLSLSGRRSASALHIRVEQIIPRDRVAREDLIADAELSASSAARWSRAR